MSQKSNKTEVAETKVVEKTKTKKDKVSSNLKVEFVVAKNSKKVPGETLQGCVISDFICPKAKQRFFKIKTDKGIFLKKADLCKEI